MHLFSYKVARDYGFAPNPFNGVCTLATCKARIRGTAMVGDWVIGTGAKGRYNIEGRLIYAMEVNEKLTFDQYWNDPRFQLKKPRMNGSLKQTLGDNIYFFDSAVGQWHQENSHHSYEGGIVNMHNLTRDTRYPNVLISNNYYYFGQNHVEIPDCLKNICISTQGYKKDHDPPLVSDFLKWLNENFSAGLLGNPIQFEFERYNGIS